MKCLILIFVFFNLRSVALSQTDTSKLNLIDANLIVANPIGNCYFEHEEYRGDGTLKKIVRLNGNGLTMIIRYNRNGNEKGVRIKKGPVMDQTPPCYN